MSDSENPDEAVRAELRALIATGIGLAERAETLAARIGGSDDPDVADRDH
ncbi:hypothetical protein C8D87_1149 [Lentzea atacamensis]|uniref:Uncharacterized protein n=1 Tax=Lentzea atacamensis TaxID=531938 RepID=A0ABX9DW69_9PSEU|nr:hypothetical protein [Lentzea atacamensis]RAS59397.1 hypothetical protein C8D87_1149 [Lentzea atacamensis]